MTRRLLVCPVLLLVLQLAAYGDDRTGSLPPVPTHSGLEKMKKLAGTWLAAGPRARQADRSSAVPIIKVTAGYALSAVQETLFPGQPHEMVSIYTVDGPNLVMTHYCVLGNQPRMKADPKSPANQIRFEFAGGFNPGPEEGQNRRCMPLR